MGWIDFIARNEPGVEARHPGPHLRVSIPGTAIFHFPIPQDIGSASICEVGGKCGDEFGQECIPTESTVAVLEIDFLPDGSGGDNKRRIGHDGVETPLHRIEKGTLEQLDPHGRERDI